MKKIVRNIIIIIVVVLIAGAMIYIALPKSYGLAGDKDFKESDVQAKAEEIVEMVGNEKYDDIIKISDAKMKKSLTADEMKKAKDAVCSDWGDFKLFSKCYIGGIKQLNKKYAVAQMNVQYDNCSVTYTISFDKNMKLAGLYMK